MTTASRAVTPAPIGLDIRTTSAAATRSLAAWLAAVAQPGDRIALMGPLGAGKTQFAKGFAAGLGVTDAVTSPSFTLMAEYRGRLQLFHQDLYRLAGAEDALDGGLLDERQDEGVTLSEWADRLDAPVDVDRLDVRFLLDEDVATTADPDAEGERLLQLAGPVTYARYLEQARSWSGELP
jgi:tRNA threonylcarbamoyladenosine biosynthesis protein TsaE